MKAKTKTGGVMVGLNGSLPVQKVPSTKGVMPGLNAKVSVQTTPRGWSGGRGNSAPKTAEPSK